MAPPVRVPDAQKLPVYRAREVQRAHRGARRIWDVADAMFIVLAVVFSAWLAVKLLLASFHPSVTSVVAVLGFYAVMAYLLLPRLHQVFTEIYVPNYFIGRTRTPDGLLGDPMNLALDGDERDVHAAMTRAGWTRADEVTIASALRMIRSTLLRTAYREAPVSDLMLFGRRQDFAYQREVGGDARKRHHVRFWRVPQGWLLPGGIRVDWVAAGTYDRRVGLSLFTMQVTHKIDPDTDAERDYIVETLKYADPDTRLRVIDGFSTAYHSRNGGGDSISTDGDLPIVDVTGAVDRGPQHEAVAERHTEPPVTRHHIPPPGLLFAGLLVILRSVQVALLIPEATDIVRSEGGGAGAVVLTAVIFGSSAVILIALWVLTLSRRRLARLLLMVVLSVDAALWLSEVLPVGSARLLVLAGAAISVVTLLAVGGTDARAWVNGRQRSRD